MIARSIGRFVGLRASSPGRGTRQAAPPSWVAVGGSSLVEPLGVRAEQISALLDRACLLRESAVLRRFIEMLAREPVAGDNHGPVAQNTLKPDIPFIAVGDIHGRRDLLESLMSKVDPAGNRQLVFLGDYIDRGPDAAGTVSSLFAMAQARPEHVICLMGNHEKMMLDFLDDPLGRGMNWLRNGGIATLESYGIYGVRQRVDPDVALAACNALETALGSDVIAWLRHLPLYWNSGNVWCVHAAMDPAMAPTAQKVDTMLWGQRHFLNTARADGTCVVHGHTIVSDPVNFNSRISIDTGAYRTNRLTAALIADSHCAFVST